jgi:hypothetical protein
VVRFAAADGWDDESAPRELVPQPAAQAKTTAPRPPARADTGRRRTRVTLTRIAKRPVKTRWRGLDTLRAIDG